MKKTFFTWIARYPVKLGMALQWFGSYLMGAGAIFQAGSSSQHWWIGPTIIGGFFITGVGGFIALLFTNGKAIEFPPLPSTIQAQTTVQTTLQAAPPKAVDATIKTEQAASP